MTGSSHTFDAIVVGGGLVGTAIALGMVRNGLSVGILDEGDIAFRASRGNFGLVWVQSKGLGKPAYAQWTRRSSDLWEEFAGEMAEETGLNLSFSRPGGYHFCLSEQEFIDRRNYMARLAAQSAPAIEFKMMDLDDLRQVFPHIGDGVVGASFTPWDGHCNPLRLFRSMHAAFAKRGGRYFPGHRVGAISKKDGTFEIQTTSGRFSAARLVLAAGNATRELAPKVGLSAPVRPERGQILVTTKLQPFLNGPTAMLRQTDEGSVLCGDSKEDAGFNDRSTPEIMRELAIRAVTTFPILGQAKIVRSWSALRIMSPDGFPIYKQSEECPGAFVACLHSGVTLAAAHVKVLGKAIAEGGLPAGFEAFGPERFDVQEAA